MSVAGHDTFGVCCVLHAFAYQIENRSVFGASDEINMGKTRFLPQKQQTELVSSGAIDVRRTLMDRRLRTISDFFWI